MPGMLESSLARGLFPFAAALLMIACSSSTSLPMSDAQAEGAQPSVGPDARHPVVVELYQSQGCSSCPPANANLNAVAGRDGILALSFAVTYWDQLGWKDSFAKPAFTARQWDYARAAGRNQVWTPQVIFNGRSMMLGGDKAHFARSIAEAGPVTGGPMIDAMMGSVVVGEGRAPGSAKVWLVRYDPAVRQVAIRAGENGGRTLPHRNIVIELADLGPWTGREVRFKIAVAPTGLRTAILIQQGKGGPIIAARKL